MSGVAGYLHLLAVTYMAVEKYTNFEHFALYKRMVSCTHDLELEHIRGLYSLVRLLGSHLPSRVVLPLRLSVETATSAR
jgi:hypothetical protein